MQKILDGMSDAGSRLNDALSGLIHSLSSLPRDFEDWQPSDLFTVADTVARVGSVGGLVETLTALPQDRFSLVPAARLTALASVFANLVQSVERAQSQFGQIADWGGFQRFDPASGQVFAQNVNGHPVLRAKATPSVTRCRVMGAQRFQGWGACSPPLKFRRQWSL